MDLGSRISLTVQFENKATITIVIHAKIKHGIADLCSSTYRFVTPNSTDGLSVGLWRSCWYSIPLPVAIVGLTGCHGDRHSSYQAVSAVKMSNSAFRINRPQTSCRVWLISRTDNGGLLKYPNSIIHSRSLPRVSKIVKVKSELPLSALAQSSSESEDKRGGKKRFHSLGWLWNVGTDVLP